ncbi:serine hydrolase domain-containing protein [Oceanobacillus halophilus]|uniref:Class A beta-lactamase-related serine hydrolase n=1 Tax=Oceanobacillus halophilus TaxID=930130 RepID=A0A495A893_9BACI|nr:serine hydrolase domain-containing protein [Oceanobacillus halophilus]RKQ35863.1 class A beta-lactamase-related serine hydrolase [Oceanobacillus halophilus]
MKRILPILFSVILVSSLFIGQDTVIHANNGAPDSTVQAKKAHPTFTWGNPAPSAPVLHPSSARGAGMLEEPLDEIDTVMEELIEDGTMPGAVTFVARSGKIVQQEAYGHALLYEDDQFTEVEEPIAMTEDTIFDLASISKIFTTTAAMKLYEDGLFELDDPVSLHIPEFAENGKEAVTIQQLMTHTSGFAPSAPVADVEGSREERLQYVLEYPLDNEPGTVYTYSDLNMITLGVLVERLSGKRLDAYVEEVITEPLGMSDTMYNPPEELKNRIAATEYQPWTDRGIVWGTVHDEKAWSLDGVAGHAGVFSTASDLAKLAQMYLNEGRYGNAQILQPETVELLVENQIPEFPGDDHGLGWELSQMWYMDALSESTSLGHTGYTGTSIVVSPNNDTIAILLTNRVHPTRNTVSTNPARRGLAQKVADAIPVDIPTKDGAWFAGYGGNVNNTLTAEVDLEEEATLSFETWYLTEQNSDIGYVEITNDGENWTALNEFSGSSSDWISEQVTIPADTTEIRFRYATDTYYNGRGWYITDTKLEDQAREVLSFELTTEDWVKRGY